MTLRPGLRHRLPFFVLSWLIFALCLTALFYNPLLGAVGVLLFGFAAANATLRMFKRRSYATELDAEGFRVYDALGRLVHDVRWTNVEHLTVFRGNGMRGAGTLLLLAWRCRPRQPGKGRQPWAKGGDEFDGALPDPYLGIDAMLELFKRHAEAAALGAADPRR